MIGSPFARPRHRRRARRPARAALGSIAGALLGVMGATAPAAVPAQSGGVGAPPGDTLAQVLDRGRLLCGVNTGLAGFAQADSLGRWSGFDVDLCRGVAAAVFGDPAKVDFRPVSSSDRFDGLVAGAYDVLSRNTTWTLERSALHGDFAGTNFYDGQGFMARKGLGLRSALELDGRPVCVSRGTTTERTTEAFFAASGIRYEPVFFDDQRAAGQGYAAGRCEAITTDRAGLAALRVEFEQPDAHMLLAEVVSKEPLGPVVRANDHRWALIVRWTLHCMVAAEEEGLDSANVRGSAGDSSARTRRITGLEGGIGPMLGLAPDWCASVIESVGNYAESYERNLGPDTPLGLPRGANALWTNGGLLYAPPF